MIVVHIPSWFPDADKPLNGNFILRQIGTLGDSIRSIVLHHTLEDFDIPMPENVQFHRVPYRRRSHLFSSYITEFQNIVKKYGKPDILHLHVALPLGPVAAHLARKFEIPLVVSEHWSVYQPMNRHTLRFYQKWLLRYVYRTAACVTAVSQNLLDNITETVPAAAGKPQAVVGNVVDSQLFALKETLPQEGRKRILHVSTLDNEAKNIMGILRAIQQLSLQRNDFQLDIVHDFQNKEAEAYVRDNGLSNTVYFLGRKTSSEIAALLQESAFFLMFSNYENQPCVLLESFCTGTPAIATPVGGIPEIANPENAVFTAPRDESQLVDKLNFMLDNFQNYDSAAIRDKALSVCSPAFVRDRWLSVYRSVTK